MPEINKETLEYLAGLGKLRIDRRAEEKLLNDLQKILAYFEELKEVDTEGIEPMAGGTFDTNVFRGDESKIAKTLIADREKLLRAFPEKTGDFLKVPPVFE